MISGAAPRPVRKAIVRRAVSYVPSGRPGSALSARRISASSAGQSISGTEMAMPPSSCPDCVCTLPGCPAASSVARISGTSAGSASKRIVRFSVL